MSRSRKRIPGDQTAPVTFDTVRQLALSWPEVEEGTSYGTPAFRVRGKLFARFHQDGESLVVRIDFHGREMMMSAEPDVFYITDHYLHYPWMLVRLANVHPNALSRILENSWRRCAPKPLAQKHDPSAKDRGRGA